MFDHLSYVDLVSSMWLAFSDMGLLFAFALAVWVVRWFWVTAVGITD